MKSTAGESKPTEAAPVKPAEAAPTTKPKY
jgi:hypothetical protein